MYQPTSKTQLQQLLISNDIDLTKWGKYGAKSLDDLWREIQGGETILSNNPLCRTIHFVQIIIRLDGKILIETEQEMSDGRIRTRNRPPAEKMKPGESIEIAALRGLQEELNLSPNLINLLSINKNHRIAKASSPSYPGLTTHYHFNTVEAAVPGLPNTDFTSKEQSPEDPIRKHFWSWISIDEAKKLAIL